MSINSFYNTLISEFRCLTDALFFTYYFITEKAKTIKDNKIFSEGTPAQIFYGIFCDILDFKNTRDISHFSIVVINLEVFVIDYSETNDNIEFCFLVPFLWYRVNDPDSTGFEQYQSGLLPQEIFIKGVDLLHEEQQLQTLQIISLKEKKYSFMIENLSEPLNKKYFCPIIQIDRMSVGKVQDIIMIIKKSGTYNIYLVWQDEDNQNIPILSFKKRFFFGESKFYSVPEYFIPNQQIVIQPKNGILPIQKYVQFKVEKSIYIRVFVVFFDDHEEKVEVFDKEEYFDRRVFIKGRRILLVGETDEFTLEGIAEYEGLPQDMVGFKEIQKDWFRAHDQDGEKLSHFSKKMLLQTEEYTHTKKFFHEVDEIVEDIQSKKLLEDTKGAKKFEDITTFLNSKKFQNLELQTMQPTLYTIIYIYLWINQNIDFTSDEDRNKVTKPTLPLLFSVPKGNSKEISYFFKTLCNMAGLTCYVVDGFKKSIYNVEQSKATHFWNVIKLGKFFYIVDCSLSCQKYLDDGDIQKMLTKEVRRDYYLFARPTYFKMSHFPEENCYSLDYNYEFNYEEFLDSAVFYPFYCTYQLTLLTQDLLFNEKIHKVFKIKFSAKSPDLIFSTIHESQVDSTKIYQRVSYNSETKQFIYHLYIFKFVSAGNFCITVALVEKNKNQILNEETQEANKKSFSIANLFESPITRFRRPKKTIEEQKKTVKYPILSFNLQFEDKNGTIEEEEKFYKPKYLENTNVTGFKRALSLYNNSNKLADTSSSIINSEIVVLSPGSYYLPAEKHILFLVHFRRKYIPLRFLADKGETQIDIEPTKLAKKLYQYSVKLKPGIVKLVKQSHHTEIVEFEVLEDFKPPQLLNLVRLDSSEHEEEVNKLKEAAKRQETLRMTINKESPSPIERRKLQIMKTFGSRVLDHVKIDSESDPSNLTDEENEENEDDEKIWKQELGVGVNIIKVKE